MERRAIAVAGIVQGVGFRPFVYHLAAELGLSGFVKNQHGEVLIEVEGERETLERFQDELLRRRPPLATVDRVAWTVCPVQGEQTFRIETSGHQGSGVVLFAADRAPCAACLAELFDPGDRRYRYPFLNCTHCGPRLTIVRSAPYDRAHTTLAGFPLCSACQAEYDDPGNRRFHAQPIACPACGPRLCWLDAAGRPLATTDPVRSAALALSEGQIVAIKGLGGYHLACDARREDVVAELRRRKQRDDKPFALLVGDLSAARSLCSVSDHEAEQLQSPRRPIVLLRRRCAALVADSVAPGNPCLGVMLPYTPLHFLLVHELAGVPVVLTSGNRSDEPIAYEDHDALRRLGAIADRFLSHDRPIHLRCDDSVTRIVAGAEQPIRRSRGYAPQPVTLPRPCLRPTLAVGGQLKNTFALGRGRHALLSHHLGDLDHYEAFRAFTAAIDHFERLFEVRPERIVHDLHPDYASTRYALDRRDIARLAVQHHHAHLASCLADNAVDEPAIGVTFDGTGYGLDGAVWGGEFLIGDCRSFRRAAHLRYVGMPGGAQAIHEPWRMALAHLVDAQQDPTILKAETAPVARRAVVHMLAQRLNCPLTSSAGRLFDAVAVLAGGRPVVRYEGQAAVELEALASQMVADTTYPFSIQTVAADQTRPATRVIDTRPLIAGVARDAASGQSARTIARRFHSTLVEIIAQVCAVLRADTGLALVALSGGVFLNALLSEEVIDRLAQDGFRVCHHRQVPANDGGLSLGQLAIAAAQDDGTEARSL